MWSLRWATLCRPFWLRIVFQWGTTKNFLLKRLGLLRSLRRSIRMYTSWSCLVISELLTSSIWSIWFLMLVIRLMRMMREIQGQIFSTLGGNDAVQKELKFMEEWDWWNRRNWAKTGRIDQPIVVDRIVQRASAVASSLRFIFLFWFQDYFKISSLIFFSIFKLRTLF